METEENRINFDSAGNIILPKSIIEDLEDKKYADEKNMTIKKVKEIKKLTKIFLRVNSEETLNKYGLSKNPKSYSETRGKKQNGNKNN